MNEKEYLLSADRVLKNLSSDSKGLSKEEASKRISTYGENKLEEGKSTPIWKRFLNQLADPMIIILIIAAVISGIISAMSHESFADVIIIMFVVVVNSILGVMQESKAEKAIKALQEMSAATSKVIRDGMQVIVKSTELVPGDIVVLESGDTVPADGRIIECASLQIEEAQLTGESVPVTKTADVIGGSGEDVVLGDRKNMIYMGSSVVYGRGKAVITATGMKTEMGKIATSLTEAKEEATPLQIKLNQLSKILTILVVAICAAIFAIDIIRSFVTTGTVTPSGLVNTFMVAVSLAVAAIPEGLVAIVTIILSIGVTKMSKNNAVIRKLTAVETLGCTQIICSDKTGTLTQNLMTVVEHYSENETVLMQAMALCNDAELDSDNKALGEPTEAALVNDAFSNNISKNDLIKEYPRIGELPFESMRKMMSTFHKGENFKDIGSPVIQFTKGAPDEVLKRCKYILSGTVIRPITTEDVKNIEEANKAMADKALRVLSVAMKQYDSLPENIDNSLEKDLCFIGLSAMIDPIREEALVAIKKCQMAGIRPIMITGDHKDTAVAIAKELGILEDASHALTGSDLNKMTDDELFEHIEDYSVYARVQPEHKVRIVKAWKKKNKVVSMTGDGVNDAPAIKIADIGVGMGITGCDVTKNVADMVLTDDNFATIVSAVEEGRRIYNNMRKTIQYLLSANLTEVLSIFIATMFGFTILEAPHLLWINLITDGFPALALGLEKGEPGVMNHKPRAKDEGIFAGGMGADIMVQAIACTVIVLASFLVGEYLENGYFGFRNSADGTTMAFLTLSMVEIFHALNMRSMTHSIFTLPDRNKYLGIAMILSWVVTTAVIYIPFLSEAFDFTHISLKEYIVAMLLAISIIPVVEIQKLIKRKKRNI